MEVRIIAIPYDATKAQEKSNTLGDVYISLSLVIIKREANFFFASVDFADCSVSSFNLPPMCSEKNPHVR